MKIRENKARLATIVLVAVALIIALAFSFWLGQVMRAAGFFK